MRVLIFSSSYLPVLGGVQTVVHTLAKGLLRKGHEVRVVTNRYPRTLASSQIIDGVSIRRRLFLRRPVYYWKERRLDLMLASLFFYPMNLLRLMYWIKTWRPDVVNVHFPETQSRYIVPMRRLFKFRLIVSLHGHEVERYFEGPEGISQLPQRSRWPSYYRNSLEMLKEILGEADCVSACSAYLLGKAKQLLPSIAGKGYVVHNGTEFDQMRDVGRYPHPRRYILGFGRLIYKKGFDLLLKAFSRVSEEYPDIDLIIAGSGPEEAELLKLRNGLGLEERALFYGPAKSSAVISLLNSCEFMVMPSRQEPFGLAALEALALGKCVLATRVGGVEEFLGGSANKIVDSSVGGLAEGLKEWLGKLDDVRKMGRTNPALARKFTAAKMVGEYLKCYRPAR